MTAYKFSTTGVQRRPCGIYVGSPKEQTYFDNPYMPLSDFALLWNKMIASAAVYSSSINFPSNSAITDPQILFENFWQDVLNEYSKAGQTFNPDTTFIMGSITYTQPKRYWGQKYSRDCYIRLRIWSNMYWNKKCKLYLSNNPSSPVNVPYNNTNIITGFINKQSAKEPTTSTGGYPLWFYVEGYNPYASVNKDNIVIDAVKSDDAWVPWLDNYSTMTWYKNPPEGGNYYFARINQVDSQTYKFKYRDWDQWTVSNPFTNLTGFNNISKKPSSTLPFNCVITNLKPEIVSKIRQIV